MNKLMCDYIKYAPNKDGKLEIMFKGGNQCKAK